MRHQRLHRKRFNNSGLIVGMAFIVVLLLVISYFFGTGRYDLKPVIYNELLTDSVYYSESKIPNWHKIDAGPFFIQTPKDYKFFRYRGIDSYIGGITNQIDTISFDYGWYSNSLDECLAPQFKIAYEFIDGKKFKIVKESSGKGYTAAYTESLKKENRLWIGCYNCNDLNEKISIFRTIEFKEFVTNQSIPYRE